MKRQYGYFNLLKFIATMCIGVLYHYNTQFLCYMGIDNPYEFKPFLCVLDTKSFLFVEMMFIISGILYVTAYQDKIADHAISFDSFILKRVVRIYPAAIISTLLMFIGSFMLLFKLNEVWITSSTNLSDLITDFLFGGKAAFNVDNTLNGVIWYINVLMLCYIWAFFLTKWSKKTGSLFVFMLPIFLGCAIMYSNVSFTLWNINIARGYISFFVGIYLGLLMKHLKKEEKTIPVTVRVILFAVALILLILWYKGFGGNESILFSMLIFPTLLLALYDISRLEKFCNTKVVTWMGNISFGIYLWNYPILFAAYYLFLSKGGWIGVSLVSPIFVIILAVVHVAVAALSYELIDKRLVRLISKGIWKNEVR